MELSLKADERLVWCRLATTGLMAVAIVAVLSLFLYAQPSAALELGQPERLLYVALECFLGAAFAWAAMRLKSSSPATHVLEETTQAAGTPSNVDALRVRSRWAAFREKGTHLWAGEEQPIVHTESRPAAPKGNDPAAKRSGRKKKVSDSDNADLARLAEADMARIRRS